jgi:C2 domain
MPMVPRRCSKLMNRDGWAGKSDPFVRVCRPLESARGLTYVPVYQSHVIMNNLNPVWQDLAMPLGTLCAGDLDTKLIWQVRGHPCLDSTPSTRA